jgi:hypothetical protein
MVVSRGYQAMGLIPNNGSVNSPKYNQVASNARDHAGFGNFQNENANFNRTGPIVLNNRPQLQDPSMQQYYQQIA